MFARPDLSSRNCLRALLSPLDVQKIIYSCRHSCHHCSILLPAHTHVLLNTHTHTQVLELDVCHHVARVLHQLQAPQATSLLFSFSSTPAAAVPWPRGGRAPLWLLFAAPCVARARKLILQDTCPPQGAWVVSSKEMAEFSCDAEELVLCLPQGDAALEALAGVALPRLRRLDVRFAERSRLSALLAAPGLGDSLQELKLWGASAASAAALAAAPLRALRALRLCGADCVRYYMGSIAAAAWAPQLTLLHIRASPHSWQPLLKGPALRALAAAPLRALAGLVLEAPGCDAALEDWAALAAAPWVAQLTRLELAVAADVRCAVSAASPACARLLRDA